MGKAYHKKRPQPPKYFWYDTDCCWWCNKKGKGCTGCKVLKEYLANTGGSKRDKIQKSKYKSEG